VLTASSGARDDFFVGATHISKELRVDEHSCANKSADACDEVVNKCMRQRVL